MFGIIISIFIVIFEHFNFQNKNEKKLLTGTAPKFHFECIPALSLVQVLVQCLPTQKWECEYFFLLSIGNWIGLYRKIYRPYMSE